LETAGTDSGCEIKKAIAIDPNYYDEAMRLARAAIRQRGDFVGAHRVLTPQPAWPDSPR
jgi:hypothetical protein